MTASYKSRDLGAHIESVLEKLEGSSAEAKMPSAGAKPSQASEIAQAFQRLYADDDLKVYQHYFVTLTVYNKYEKLTPSDQELSLLTAIQSVKDTFPKMDYMFVLELTKQLVLHAHIWMRVKRKDALYIKGVFERSPNIGRMQFVHARNDANVYDYIHKDIEETASYFKEDFRCFHKKTRMTLNESIDERIKALDKRANKKVFWKKAEYADESGNDIIQED